MRKVLLFLVASILIISCKEKPLNDFVSLSGKFENIPDSTLTINGKNLNKEIKINKDGTFKDTLKVESLGYYTLRTSSQVNIPIYLNNGYDLKINADANDVINSVTYEGYGEDSNNFTTAQIVFTKKMGDPNEFFSLEKEAFDTKINGLKAEYETIFNTYKNIDSSLLASSKTQNTRFFDYFTQNYERNHSAAKAKALAMAKVAVGNLSPAFTDYENYKGGKNSLPDYKGKYVYIDLWATWCGPCIREIPSLERLEKEYHDKNIEFISISIDNNNRAGTWENAHKKWKDFVKKRNLTGVQLWAGKDTQFQSDYHVTGIPRFILIDDKGKIVSNNAPRPSNPSLKTLFNELGI
ncbi:thiol-disulfide isomerase/thioredoxin [Lutibacter sp. Hel_I_33_5]|uniref:TlpA disulfide reductase family protein n=1 Tax=Lutibacter sp. Hel_I_33_5 TaxID=1566289 RepID=UPI0011A50823|nr:TlpA disulfide reductase family protein [Lutibacter sp. Hel_I_33_5]TVZ55669.1 thiol-disulfide isomerase/thioredoxin [Lutibacter sp. Hel_I_33_5]